MLDLGLKKDFDRDFEMGGMLGRGSFAVVRLCTHRATGETFAVKIMTKRCQKGQASLETQFAARVHHEVDMLRTLGKHRSSPVPPAGVGPSTHGRRILPPHPLLQAAP